MIELLKAVGEVMAVAVIPCALVAWFSAWLYGKPPPRWWGGR